MKKLILFSTFAVLLLICIIPSHQYEAHGESIIATIPLPGCSSPDQLEFDPVNGNIYVACNNGGGQHPSNIDVINSTTGTIVSTITVGVATQSITVNPANGKIYVADGASSRVYLINGSTNTIISQIHIGTNPNFSVFDPVNGNIYVTNEADGTVSIISGSTNAIIGTIPATVVGGNPFGITFDPVNNDLYVVDNYNSVVKVVNTLTNTLVATIPVGSNAFQAKFNPVNGNIYVSNNAGHSVSVISGSTNTVIATDAIGNDDPEGITINPVNGNIYVLGNSVSVISSSTNTITGVITVGASPEGISINPANGNVYVLNTGDDTISVIGSSIQQGSTIQQSTPAYLNSHSYYVAIYNPSPDNRLYDVANQNGETINSLLNKNYHIIAASSGGLYSGTYGGTLSSSTNTTKYDYHGIYFVALYLPSPDNRLYGGSAGNYPGIAINSMLADGGHVLDATIGQTYPSTWQLNQNSTTSSAPTPVILQGTVVILHDSDGSGCHKITVNSAGTISTTNITCP